MNNCPYCDFLINEDYNLCVNCERQVKCFKCSSYLIKDKSKCLKCGTILNKESSSAIPMNIFSLEEEQTDGNYSRKINLSFTDGAIDKVSSVINGYVPFTPSQSSKQISKNPQQLALPFTQVSSDKNQLEQSEADDEVVVETTAKIVSDDNTAHGYFDKDSQGFLISTSPDYKGKNKKLQQQRFSLLYVWAYNSIYGEPVPNKEHLSQAAKLNGVYDQNYSQHLTDVSNRYFIKSDGTFKLNPSGKSHLKEIQSEMKIEDVELKGFDYANSTRKKSNRTSRTTKEDSQKVEQWIQLPTRFSDFDVRKLKNAYEIAILSLYDITKEIKVENAVKASLAYEYINKRYKTISVTRKNFNDTLSRKIYEKYFEHTPEGLYYLTHEAESFVENLLNEQNL